MCSIGNHVSFNALKITASCRSGLCTLKNLVNKPPKEFSSIDIKKASDSEYYVRGNAADPMDSFIKEQRIITCIEDKCNNKCSDTLCNKLAVEYIDPNGAGKKLLAKIFG